jgi:hypothetical protein
MISKIEGSDLRILGTGAKSVWGLYLFITRKKTRLFLQSGFSLVSEQRVDVKRLFGFRELWKGRCVMSKLSMIAVVGVLSLLALFVTSAYAQETVTLTVNSAYGSPDPSVGVHSYAKGTELTASVATPVAGGTGIQYACVGWKSKGSVPSHPGEIAAIGFTNSVTFTINSNVVLTWRWKAQYLLTLNVSPHLWAGHINFYCDSHPEEPSGTYPPTDGGYWTYLRVAQLTAVADRDYVFDHWSGGSQVLRLEPWKNPTVQKMRRPETITAVFLPTAQYTLTIVSAYGDPQGAGVYDPGMQVDWSATSPYPVDAVGTRYVALDPTSGTTPPMYEDITVTINWKTQYQLTTAVAPEGNGSISMTPEPEVGGWYDANTIVSCLATPIENWGFLNWGDDLSGANNPENLTMSEAREITANFFQPILTVASDYDSPDPAVGEHTYNFGATVTGSVTSPLPIVSSATALNYSSVSLYGPYYGAYNMGLRFTATKNLTITKVSTNKGTGTVPVTIWTDAGTLLAQVDVPGCVEGVWTEADVSPPLAVTAGQTYRIAAYYGGVMPYYYQTDVMPATTSDITALGWCYGSGLVFPNASGTGYVFGLANFKYEIFESQYRCTGYTGTGSCPSGTELSVPPFVINTDSTLTWNWTIQHKLTVGVSPAGSGTVDISPPTGPLGDSFFDVFTEVTLTANPIGVNALDYWSGGGMSGNASPTTITIDGPKSITANFARPRLVIANPKAAGTPSPAVGTYTYDRGASATASIAGPPVWIPQIAGPPVTILNEGFEGSWPPSGWTVGTWTRDSGDKHSGTYSARDYNTSPSSTHSIYTTVNMGASGGSVTFWWRTACGYNGSRSRLAFLIDGSTQTYIYYNRSWASLTYSLSAGTHTLRWDNIRYSSSSSTYNIYGYVDDVTVIGTSMIPDPNNKFVFQGYAGTGSCPNGTDASVTFNIETNSTLTWLWTGYHKLFTAVGSAGGGSVSVSVPPDAEGYYDDVTPVVLTAVADEGWVFLNWSGDQTGSTNPVTVAMTQTRTITANFGHSLVVASDYGAPSPAAGTYLYTHNASVTVNCGLTPYPGPVGTRYVCTGHLGTGNLTDGSETSMTFPITLNSSVTWLWDVQTNWYIVTASVNPAGKGSVTLDPAPGAGGWVYGGTVISCLATPIAGWGWVGWSGDLGGNANPENLTVDNNKTIIANFFQPTLEVINPQGVGSPSPPAGTATYNYDASVTCSVTPFAYEVMSGIYNEGFETGLSAFWTKGGDANWFISTRGPYSGAYSAESGDIGDSKSTYLERPIIIGAGGGTVSFYWTVSSENNYDWLEFYIDGVRQTPRISGSWGWTPQSFSLAEGMRTLRWRYMKDSSVSSGWDGGMVDDIQVTNTTFAPVNYKCMGYSGTGSCPSGTANSVTFNITQNSSITWNWSLLCKLTASVYPPGTGTVSLDPTAPGDLYDPGATVTLTATATATGYVFANWSSGNVVHQYQFINQAKTWQDAKADCEARGGYLATISSGAENALVTNLAPPGTWEIWIGFTDEASEGTWAWITGEPALYTNWNEWEPNDAGGDEDHAEISIGTGRWNDNSGWRTRAYVCEFEVSTDPPLSSDNPVSIVVNSSMNVTANFAVPDVPYNFAGTATSASAITWSWAILDPDSSITSFEVQDSGSNVLGTVSASPWPETGLSENTQYTRHVHAVGGGESGDVSRYTLVHDALASDFTLTFVGGAVTTQTKTPATGNNTMTVPIDISANYARCQMLFYGSEIGMGGTPGAIYKIRFTRRAGDADTVNNVEIYMTHTTLGTPGMPGTGLTSWQDTSTQTLVYSGNLNIPTGGEDTLYEITLGPAFNYNGSSNLIVTVRHQDGSGEASYTTWKGNNFSEGTYYCLAGASNTVNPPAVAAVVSRPNTQFDVSTGGGVMVSVTPPPNSTAASTGVRIERDTDPGFSMPVLVQNYAPRAYSKGDRPPGAGTYYYRIIFRNGDTVPSAYSAGNSVVVP